MPSAHLTPQSPPQSMALSRPLRTPSLHVGVAHVPVVQTPLLQSLAVEQVSPLGHKPQLPPQSTPVSSPFFTPSAQLGDLHTPRPASQVPLEQSVLALHAAPLEQRAGHVGPPQSGPDSSLLVTPSSHVPSAHVPLAASHTPLSQSPPDAHAAPTKHGEHDGPPQSTWLSPPLRTPSEHVAAAHMSGEPWQTPLLQS